MLFLPNRPEKNLGSDVLFDDLLMSLKIISMPIMIIDYQKWLSQNIERN